ncbi:hypothetical protein TNCV_170231 [Trichonephila clavipes]|nr:hypothetical protein TNCV_170231 [Trichonephila clavipes]
MPSAVNKTQKMRRIGGERKHPPSFPPRTVYAGGIVDDFSSGGLDKGRGAKKGQTKSTIFNNGRKDRTLSSSNLQLPASGYRSHPFQWGGARFATEWTT